ncbi:uncharacterized protein PV09_04778 [Verruconis gallopava]|uniref:Zn(2)-C6 fungal-type domain-containing protein n=1 Tax=Verruconis gallopava TaxID=253628 RepID=A0A0D1XMY7_9PEZI|nr:uncharacterized protein PV09_04778 [Verruconis gallopava]KIW03941.1 hypothetical protein PV09_04778 [Verruconis gallopava]
MPKLRSKTGCLTCRSRRKKCDETRDRCENCSRNALKCSWPTKDQEKDRRHRPRKDLRHDPIGDGEGILALIRSSGHVMPLDDPLLQSTFSSASPITRTPFQWRFQAQLVESPSATEESSSPILLAYFVHEFLPRRIHPRSDRQYFDFSYTYELARSCPTLRYACSACAMCALAEKSQAQELASRAHQFYSQSICSLRRALQGGACDGTEDWLLATVVTLCLYENRKPEYDPSAVAAHIAAAGQVFRKRAQMSASAGSISSYDQLSNKETLSSLIFERVFTESFLYHCMVMSVQEKTLAPLQEPLLRNIFDSYFDNCALSTSPGPEYWPVLGMHYCIIRLLSDILASLDKLLIAQDALECWHLEDLLFQLQTWKDHISLHNDGLHVHLYISAANLLVYRNLSLVSTYEHYDMVARDEAERCIKCLSKINISQAAFTRYFNWPLAILERTIQDTKASHIIREKIKEVCIDSAATRAFNWIADGFEKRFKLRSDHAQTR